MSASNIQVAIKVRPILRKEKEQKQSSNWKVAGNSIQLIDGQPEPFYFDKIFDQDVNNQLIFDTMAKQIVDSGLRGFNGTIFAYGQTSSGKTYTMMGDEHNPGVMVLASKEIFKEIEKAADRQFLVRVGYIEIYNEKIYDLLNKSNQDLKIHETPNGDVSVNCSEYIITCEEDLLSYLCMGSKSRKIGETNMNERSSRSHAIFRIIIESRKTETDEDSVQISILNLVDLAGSERADQTGATGSRLKEGGHINKSLLFLSRVIKQLAEDKYVSYRDSKLTRILQASLGGNALTAIICTVNPTAVEETLSTLSFANRAKAVKNTPQVNEVLTDAAMMKRLEKEINRLQNELEVEKSKNSQIKVGQLQKRLNEEVLKIINSNSSHTVKAANEKRRRTWCPSSAFPPLIEESGPKTETCLPHPMFPTQMPTKLQLPKSGINFTPHITLRDVYYQNELKDIQCTPSIDEEFMPAEDMCFDTPKSSPTRPEYHTPKAVLNLRTASLTPRLTEKESLQKVERELKELEAFTNLENKLNVDHDTYTTLKYKLENAERIIGRYEKEREDFAFMRVEHVETETKLANCQKRSNELETQVNELQSKIKEFETSAKSSSEQIVRYEKEVTELKTRISQLEMENREAVSLEVEFDQHKTKSKRRENELLGALDEKQKEINKLQRSLQTITVDVLNQSREEVKKMSRSLNESDPSCAKCEDYKLIFAENEKLTKAFEELNSSFGDLKLSLEKTTSEAESAKLKADNLETENGTLKKEAEHLKALNVSVDELQAQVTGLQMEKCKLESVKIEFEVMSKEIANKIAEKISISQEIENLNSLKSRLSAECEKVQSDLSASGCLKDEMEKLRSENQVLHSELQTIKLKLESTQSECTSLMTENQYKSDNYEKLNSELLSVQTLLHTVQSEYHDIQLKYEQIQAECNKHEGTIGEIQSEYKSIQKKYQSLQREYEKLENDSVQSIADCDRVQNENENLETEIRDLKTKVEEAQRKLLENDSLQLELESLKSEMNRLQDEYDRNLSMKRKSASPSKEENEKILREENAKLKGDLLDLQQRFNEMQTEYDDISTQLVDTFADYETLQGEVARLEAELEQNKNIEVADRLSENFKTMQFKTEQLEAENAQLLKENVEWKTTIMSMSESMREKCDEREQLVAQLEQVKNESMTGEPTGGSKEKLEHFLQLTESFVEIEIPTLNGACRRFKVTGPSSLRPGNRMTIGAINEIVRGSFNEMRGAIEFAVSAVESKSDNEIYDSLDVENNSMSGNSCDSLEAETKSSNNTRIRELVEEKSEIFEKLRSLEEALAKLKIENAQLRTTKEQLTECEKLIEQLNEDKMHLHAICDENNCKMSELNEIISRAESDNKKLIVDCEQLKETVESEAGEELDCYVSRECFTQLQRLHEEVLGKQRSKDELDHLPTLADIERELRSSLNGFNPTANGDETDRVISQNMAQYRRFQDQLAKYEVKITNLEKLLSATFLELKGCLEKGERLNGFDVPSFAESKTETCKCAELQAALEEKSKQAQEIEATKTEKYEQDICSLLEQLKQQQCKCQEVQIEIIDLKTSLEEKVKESAERLAKFEELHCRFAKLQSEHDELQKAFAAAKFEESDQALKQSEENYKLLQKNVKSLEETIITLENEREELQKQKESIEEQYKAMEAKSAELQQTIDSVGNAMGNLCSSNLDLKSLEEMAVEFRKEYLAQKHALKDMESEIERIQRDKESLEKECDLLRQNEQMHVELQKVENEKKELMSEREILKNSERSLHGELQRLVQENELAVRDKEIAEREYQNAKIEFENTKEVCAKELLTENERLQEQLQKFITLDEEKEALVSQLDALKNSDHAMKLQMEKLQEDCTAAKNEVERLEKVCLQAKDDVRHWKRECEQQEELINKIEAECRRVMELKKTIEEEKSELETLRNSEKNAFEQLRREMESLKVSEDSLQDRLRQLQDDHEIAVREKERLDNENSQSKILVEKLASEHSAKAREIEDLVRAKSRLESEVETLKAEHDAFQKSMVEKCALVTENLEDVSAAKLELIAAVEKANKRAEQVSKENKDIEVKYKAELNALSSTKDLMAKEIDTLKQKLLKAEEDLKTAISGVDSEKNKLISKLTDSTSSLTAQNSELEDKLTQLEQQLEELKEALSTERILKEALDKNSSVMENVIADLNTKNIASGAKLSEMDTQMVDLRRELQETQRKLQAETNLKDVLEKANAERDDLIVSLTNNNNSLARRAKDLEEKLAILGNQFEESKRHLSTEVAKLNQLLTQANEMNLNQSSRIEDLTFKVTELQGELERTEKAILERDSLLLKLDQVQAEYDTLSVKHANLELTRSSFEAELNSARAVVLENTALTKQLNEVQSNLKELEHKCSELNSTNEALNKTNVELAAQLKDTSQQATKCNQLNEEIGKLQAELEKTRESLREEQNRTSIVLKSKEREFAGQISNLESNVSSLKAEKQVTQEKLENLEKTSSAKIADMERHVQCLQKEMAGLICKTTISPRREKAIDHLMGENHQLKVKNMSLMDKLDSCSKSQNEERKNRRLSTHDERRMQSFWDTNRDVCTMTDPTSADCNCSELDRKLNEIKQKLLIRDSQVNTLSMELKNHPLKTETATLKKMLIEEESKQQHLRQEVKKYKQLLMSRTNESKACSRCADHAKKIFLNSCTQTIESDESESYRKLAGKYEDLKMICRGRHAKIKELEDALSGKENSNVNFTSLPNQQYRQKYELLKKEFKIIQEKYEEAKLLCNRRYEEIKNLTSQLKANS